ncbi:Branched-chain amino acid aminotransferase [Phytophthora cinnamomi]|uniref:Branched-chain amino acid aminotransferase n=1 Tax=Phytophthora cinnamomi TaxID=4785 RepID=UPI0035596503|nr:Branched-chain amino acid aminotransferase [Phytophthora cinnamomi]
MGAAGSIECTQYDEAKFLQSKAVMESAVDDAEKFAKLKSIWADGAPPAAAAAGAAPAADAHRKSVKDLPAADLAAALEGHKEDGHAHNEDGHAHKEGEHHHKDDGHAHKDGEHHHDHKDGEHHHHHDHKDGEHHHDHKGEHQGDHPKEEHHDHKKEEATANKEDTHKGEAHAPKEDGQAETPKEAPKVPSASASMSKLPSASSEQHDDKLSKEA